MRNQMGQTSLFRLMLLRCGKGVQHRCFSEQRIALHEGQVFFNQIAQIGQAS